MIYQLIKLALILGLSQAWAHDSAQAADDKCLNSYLSLLPPNTALVIEINNFKVNRGLGAYQGAFSAPDLPPELLFRTRLDTLTPDQHWIDVGCGLCRAAMQFLEERGYDFTRDWSGIATPRAPRITGLSLSEDFQSESKPFVEAYRNMRANAPTGRPRVLIGTPVETIPNPLVEIGRANLITDVFGAFSYSPRIDLVLQRYLELLEPGGVAYVVTPLQQNSINIKDAAGNAVRLEEYVSRIRGAEIQVHRIAKPNENNPRAFLTIRRNSEAPAVPELQLRYMETYTPPRRFFRLNSAD
jgi:SAM-dependent methyltransferase